jgi:predicted acetyltransferase
MTFLLDHRADESWLAYLERRDANRRGEQLPEGTGWVASSLLAAIVDGELVGRVSIRHELNDWLARFGGHVGYIVIPSARRRGYGTEILRQALIIARSLGIDDVLVFCDVDNVASARVIEACGGQLESVVKGPEGDFLRRYWIG